MMRLLFPLLGHLLVTLARLASPGGVRAVVAESLAVKHQLLIMKRSQRRAPNLTAGDRLMLGFYTLLVPSKRVRKMAVITKPSTLLRLHQALVKRKYHLPPTTPLYAIQEIKLSVAWGVYGAPWRSGRDSQVIARGLITPG